MCVFNVRIDELMLDKGIESSVITVFSTRRLGPQKSDLDKLQTCQV